MSELLVKILIELLSKPLFRMEEAIKGKLLNVDPPINTTQRSNKILNKVLTPLQKILSMLSRSTKLVSMKAISVMVLETDMANSCTNKAAYTKAIGKTA